MNKIYANYRFIIKERIVMAITINGKEASIEKELTIKELLDVKNIEMKDYITVQLNQDIIPTKEYENQLVKVGDDVEFLYYMGGGSQ